MRWLAAGAALLALAGRSSAAQAGATLATGSASVRFDDAGRLVSMSDLRTGRELLAGSAPSGVFALEISRGGSGAPARSVGGSEAARATVGTDSGGAIVVRFEDLGGTGIVATCRVARGAGDGLLHWSLMVDGAQGWRIEATRFPILEMAARPTGDVWVTGSTKGGALHGPGGWYLGRYSGVTQPGTMAAAFGAYYDGDGGLYVADHEAAGAPRTLSVVRTGTGLRTEWRRQMAETGGRVTVKGAVTGAFGGQGGALADWRDAADIYKQWALKQPWCARTLAQRSDLPGWLRAGPAMVRFDRGWLAEPAAVERWMATYWRRAMGGGPIITAYWGWEHVETWVTPEYFPAFPSDPGFRALVRRLRPLGGHAFLWPSGYHYTLTFGKQPGGRFRWDDRARFEATARAHTVIRRDGSAEIGDRSWLEGGQNAFLCGGDGWVRDWFDRTGAGCSVRGGELIQVDQVVGGSFPACWSAAHGHPPGPGAWMTAAFDRQLRTLLTACRRGEPGAAVGFEEPNERFLQRVGIQDYRDWEVVGPADVEPASVFAYLYHEFVPLFQSNPRGDDRVQSAWCFVNGQMPHLVPVRETGPGPALAGGGFEQWSGSAPAGWDRVGGYQGEVWTGRADRDGAVRHGGSASLRLSCAAPGQVVQVSRNLTVGGGFAPGRRYRLGVWARSGGTAPGNALMAATFTAEMRATWSGAIPVADAAGGWAEGAVEFTVPEGSRLLRVMLHLRGPGTVWLDDLRLEEILPDNRRAEVQRAPVPADHALMKRWVELYRGAGRPWLLHGRMAHPAALECGTFELAGRRMPAILHAAWIAPDGRRAVAVANATDRTQSGLLRADGRRVAIRLGPWEVRLIVAPSGARRAGNG